MLEFRHPVGLVLTGGAAHGAWQTGFLQTFIKSGFKADLVLGVSAGSLTGAAYFVDRMDEICDRWRNVSDAQVLTFAPSINPPALFSARGIYESVEYTHDDERCKQVGRCEFVVMTIQRETGQHHYAHFQPWEGGRWDGPLTTQLVASCAIPYLFPPVPFEVKGQATQLIDGGAYALSKVSFEVFKNCKDLFIIDCSGDLSGLWDRGMLKRFWPQRFQSNRNFVPEGIESLMERPSCPRIHRFRPQMPLEGSWLAFESELCEKALLQGFEEAEAALSDPSYGLVHEGHKPKPPNERESHLAHPFPGHDGASPIL